VYPERDAGHRSPVDLLRDADPAWVVLTLALAMLAAIPVLRWLAPAAHRHRGGGALLFFALSLSLAMGAIALGNMGGASAGSLVQLVALLALAIGLVATAGLVVFDLLLARLGVNVPAILRDFLQVGIAIAVTVGFLRLAGLDVFSLVTTSAVLTAIIGLALQSTIANVFGGLGLQLDRTLGHGEWIQVGNRIGQILEIGWRSTRIVTKDGDTVFVPNSALVSGEVLNFSRPTGAHRMTIRVGFHDRHSPREVRSALLPAIQDVPGVLRQPAPDCGPVDFGDGAITYALRYWIEDFAHDITIDEAVRTRLWYAARRAALEVPYPTRMLTSPARVAAERAAAARQDDAERLGLLARVEPFASLDLPERERIAHAMQRLDFGEGETILRGDGPDDATYLVASGEVRVEHGTNGRRQETAPQGDGWLFSAASSAGGPTTRWWAGSEVTVYRIQGAAEKPGGALRRLSDTTLNRSARS